MQRPSARSPPSGVGLRGQAEYGAGSEEHGGDRERGGADRERRHVVQARTHQQRRDRIAERGQQHEPSGPCLTAQAQPEQRHDAAEADHEPDPAALGSAARRDRTRRPGLRRRAAWRRRGCPRGPRRRAARRRRARRTARRCRRRRPPRGRRRTRAQLSQLAACARHGDQDRRAMTTRDHGGSGSAPWSSATAISAYGTPQSAATATKTASEALDTAPRIHGSASVQSPTYVTSSDCPGVCRMAGPDAAARWSARWARSWSVALIERGPARPAG